MELYEKLSKDGFRVLAVATKDITPKDRFTKEDEVNLQSQGFVAFMDPPKENVDTHNLDRLGAPLLRRR